MELLSHIVIPSERLQDNQYHVLRHDCTWGRRSLQDQAHRIEQLQGSCWGGSCATGTSKTVACYLVRLLDQWWHTQTQPQAGTPTETVRQYASYKTCSQQTDKHTLSYSSIGTTVVSKCCRRAFLPIRLATSSAVPVWLPYRTRSLRAILW